MVTPLTEHCLRGMAPPEPDGDSKDGRGRVLVVAGCTALPGAVLLCANAALRAGAGKLQIAACRDIAAAVGIAVPEAMVVALPQTPAGSIDRACADDLADRAGRADGLLIGLGMV